MATQLWCCDFCNFQDESRSNVEKHEKLCHDDDFEIDESDEEN
jgi:hypothetical protein